jgi:heterodisulfide reductase subunit C
MIQPDAFPDWGPNIQKVEGDLQTLRNAIPVKTLQTVETAWEVSLKTSVEMYTIWEMTGVLASLETMDENLYDVIEDFIDEKREDYEDWLEEQEEEDDE